MDHEAEFAACLLSCGGPDRLRPAGHNREPLRQAGDSTMFPITSADYMFNVAEWYDKNIESFIDRCPASDTIEFTTWWVNYKNWLVENWRD